MTHDPVMQALVDLVQTIERNRGTLSMPNLAYQNALKVIREHVAPGGGFAAVAVPISKLTVGDCYRFGMDVKLVRDSSPPQRDK